MLSIIFSTNSFASLLCILPRRTKLLEKLVPIIRGSNSVSITNLTLQHYDNTTSYNNTDAQICHSHGGTGPHNLLEFTKQEGSILHFQIFSINSSPIMFEPKWHAKIKKNGNFLRPIKSLEGNSLNYMHSINLCFSVLVLVL